ncbi:MAG: DUF2911 domain-containing protein [Gemmatimonadaceae bacterium]|nr:DUF2911 domain-containing protein [Gemmatimonadaceae bacterium]MDQ3517217.1 DUF2911 domain-containing protein [Gemmatimonadota bacterium]
MRVLPFFSFSVLVLGCAQSPRATDVPPPTATPAEATPPASEPQAAQPSESARPMLSPPGTANATIGGANIAVSYSRPSMRGRPIYGALVPFNEVWRTGANSATTFTTSRDLMFDGVSVPAGNYTLYTLPKAVAASSCDTNVDVALARPEEMPSLIINRQTGQWGTEYKEDMDLARIPMGTCKLSAPVEQFEISIVPAGDDRGVIKLMWETTQYSVPFRVKS